MGSLLPGWDSMRGNLPPKDLRSNIDEEEEPKGYFAKLEKNRSLRRRSVESTAAYPNLQRTSAPLATEQSWSPKGRDLLYENLSSPIDVRRSSDWPFDSPDTGFASITEGAKVRNFKSSSMPKDGTRWWKKLSSGFLNEPYADEYTSKDQTNSYTPQFTVTGQAFNYSTLKSTEGSGDTPIVTGMAADNTEDVDKDQVATASVESA